MAREARKISLEGLYIVELHGDRLFRGDDDKKMFIETAEKYFSDGGRIYGYLLTDTTVRMAVKESVKGISMAMKSLTVSYARYFNKAHQINGALFSGRFKSVPLYSEAEAEDAAKNLNTPAAVKKPMTKKTVSTANAAAPKKPTQKKSASKKPANAAASAAVPLEKPATNAAADAEQKPKPKKKALPSWLL